MKKEEDWLGSLHTHMGLAAPKWKCHLVWWIRKRPKVASYYPSVVGQGLRGPHLPCQGRQGDPNTKVLQTRPEPNRGPRWALKWGWASQGGLGGPTEAKTQKHKLSCLPSVKHVHTKDPRPRAENEGHQQRPMRPTAQGSTGNPMKIQPLLPLCVHHTSRGHLEQCGRLMNS